MLEEKGLFVGDLGEQRRHMQDVVGRIGSDMRLLEEKGRNMVARLSEMRGTLSGSEHQRRRTVEELSDVNRQLDEERAAATVASDDVTALEPASDELHARRVELDEAISALVREQREVQRTADAASLDLVKVKETLSNAEIEDGMYARRLEQIDEEADELQVSLDFRRTRVEELEAELEGARDRRDEAKGAVDVALAALDDLRDKEVRAREKLADVRSELSGLRKVDASLSDASPLTARVVGNHPDAIAARLGDVIEAPVEIEGLVEQLLAGDIDALVCMSGPALARAASFALEAGDATGEALLLARDVDAPPPCDGAPGYRLVERLQVRDGYAPAVAALLGHVYVVDTLDEALAAPALPGVLYVTPQGARVRDGGVVRVGASSGAAAGSLERKRRIRELERFEPELVAVFDRAVERVAEAADAIEQARAAERDAAGSISRLEGERSSLLSEVGRMEHSLSVSSVSAQTSRGGARRPPRPCARLSPRVDELEQTRDEARERLDDLGRRIAEAQDDLERVRRDDAEAGSKLADAKVRLARANERVKSLSARVPELERRLEGIDRRIRGTEQSARSLEVLRLRVDPLHDRYQALSERAMDWAARLRDRASLEEADSASLKRTIEDAKGEVVRAKVEVDLATAAVNDAKVARGKLEVQVEAAVRAITADGTTVLEEALQLPAPDDRAAAERELNSLVRQINNLGPVNQVAMEEYEALKQRADYIAAQLEDLEGARKALTKITAAIDRKMRTSFLTTSRRSTRTSARSSPCSSRAVRLIWR